MPLDPKHSMVPGVIALTDGELKTVMLSAAALPVGRRDAFLRRVADAIGRGADLHTAVRQALAESIVQPAA